MSLPPEPEILSLSNMPLKRQAVVMSGLRLQPVTPLSVQKRSPERREITWPMAHGPRMEPSSPDSWANLFLTSFHVREVTETDAGPQAACSDLRAFQLNPNSNGRSPVMEPVPESTSITHLSLPLPRNKCQPVSCPNLGS